MPASDATDTTVLEAELGKEGFNHAIAHTDPPGFVYPQHQHPVDTVRAITRGSMTVVVSGQSRTLQAGDRLVVSKGIEHAVTVGPEGCDFVVAVRM